MTSVLGVRSRFRTHALAYAGLAALFLISVTHFARDAVDRIDAVRHASHYVRDPFELGLANWGAIDLQPEAEAAGLKRGDALLAVNGNPVDGFIVYYGALRRARTGDQSDLTAVMANLNKLVYESSAPNRYATFFYAELDTASRALNYVNAGHNPPMLFRQSDGDREMVRLDTGGPVIGPMEDCVYRQGHVVLEPGDVLVAYTDGISEAMNASEVEWGEERLMDAVRPNRTASGLELIDRLMAAADAFVAGAPQHDDMTLIVMRVM
jgi:hypothetical protein